MWVGDGLGPDGGFSRISTTAIPSITPPPPSGRNWGCVSRPFFPEFGALPDHDKYYIGMPCARPSRLVCSLLL